MGACGWETVGCEECAAYASLSPEVQAMVDEWAVNRLWEWTYQRFGACTEVARPCRKTCNGYPLWGPALVGGHFINLSCGMCSDACSCRVINQVKLPGPILEPVIVQIGTEEIPLEQFRVDNNNLLVWQEGHFPVCQDMNRPLGEEDTWGVTYLLGEAVPAGGEIIAGILACEYAKSMCGDSSCRLPKRVSSIQRQGLVIGILDNFSGLAEGFTGIWEIDDWIMTQNKPRRRSTVTSPDVQVPRITTWQYADS